MSQQASDDRAVSRSGRASCGPGGVRLKFVIVDDGPTDGTGEMLRARDFKEARVKIVRGDGGLYWAGGMRCAMTAGRSLIAGGSHVLLLNDRTQLRRDALSFLLDVDASPRAFVVGTTVDPITGQRTYGGLRRASSLRRLTFVPVEQVPGARCETMNANAVLVGAEALANIGPFV